MRDDRQRLLDILEAANLLLAFRQGKNRDDLTRDLLLQSGFLHQLYVIEMPACDAIKSIGNLFDI